MNFDKLPLSNYSQEKLDNYKIWCIENISRHESDMFSIENRVDELRDILYRQENNILSDSDMEDIRAIARYKNSCPPCVLIIILLVIFICFPILCIDFILFVMICRFGFLIIFPTI